MPRTVERFGWIPDNPDPRDVFFSPSRQELEGIKNQMDLREQITFDPYDQGDLGSCTANAIGAAIEYQQGRQGMEETFTPSRLFIYYNERVVLNTVNSDSGAMLRDGLKSVSKEGVPPEELWPYDISEFKKKPPKSVYTTAAERKVLLFRRVNQSLNDMRVVLSLEFPFVFGFTVFKSFMSKEVANTGVVPMPTAADRSAGIQGGHAVLAVGFDDDEQHFIVLNSWGKKWGDKGYFYMPYAYLPDPQLARDFWTIQLVQ
jgi:C1A family cysteine protease